MLALSVKVLQQVAAAAAADKQNYSPLHSFFSLKDYESKYCHLS
jgi:hypothetical protein